MSARPTEVKAAVELLLMDWETPEALAKALIDKVDQVRSHRVDYAVLVRTGRIITAYGPFPTKLQAERAITQKKVPLIEGDSVAVAPLYGQLAMAKMMDTEGSRDFGKIAVDSAITDEQLVWDLTQPR